MTQFVAMLTVFGVDLVDRVQGRLTSRPERGSETIEKVLWAVAVIALVAIVVTAIRSYVTTESANIR